MKHSRVILAAGLFLVVFQNMHAVYAQDTFGPICDGVTVTCPPDTPSPTAVPGPTSVSNPVPNQPPRAGHQEALLMLMGIAALFITSGILLRRQADVQV